MKSAVLFLLVPACLFAQATPAPTVLNPQQPAVAPKPVGDDAVVAKVNGRNLTAAEVRKMIAGAPPQIQQGVSQSPEAILNYLFFLQTLHQLALEDKVDEQSPWKEQLVFARLQMLAQAELNMRNNQTQVTQEDLQKDYDANKNGKYLQAKIRVIYVGFAI